MLLGYDRFGFKSALIKAEWITQSHVDSLLFLGACIICRAGGHIDGPVLLVPKARVRCPE